MIEILFSESAAGSMKFAKGLKKIAGEALGIILKTEDGHAPTDDEIARERARMEEKRRKKLENAVPMEGSAHDVAYFPLNLSTGDISDPMGDTRAAFLQSQTQMIGSQFSGLGAEMMDAARESLNRVLSAVEDGQPIRVWTSQNPDELCGLCHILTLLPGSADVRVIEMPRYEVRDDGCVCTCTGWGEVDPLDLGRYQQLERPLCAAERRYLTASWRQLQRENGPLRAVVNGRLVTVGADFYDWFLLRELEYQPEEFHEGRYIGSVMGRYPLGLGDWLIARRVEEFISRGMLTLSTEPEEDRPIYHRYLRKNSRWN